MSEGGLEDFLASATVFRFEDSSPFEMTLTDPSASLDIVNDSAEEVPLVVKLEGSVWEFLAAKITTDAQPQGIELPTESFVLGAAETAEVKLSLADREEGAELKNDHGSLVLYSQANGGVERREIRFSVEQPPPKPLFSKWQIQYWRTIPFSRCLIPRGPKGSYLPFAPSQEPEEVSREPIG